MSQVTLEHVEPRDTHLLTLVYERNRYTTIVTEISPSDTGANVIAMIDGTYNALADRIRMSKEEYHTMFVTHNY